METHWKDLDQADQNSAINQAIGQRIRDARLAAGLMGKELNNALKYRSRNSVSKMELGTTRIAAATVVQIADILGADVRDLLGQGLSEVSHPAAMDIRRRRTKVNYKVGLRLQVIREERGVSREELAKAMGYRDESSVARVERGESELNPWALVMACTVLKCTASRIIGI